MPLFKRKPFPLTETPTDLKPQENVFQVRFTKEIFRSYSEYLNRIDLYRRRVWTCKVTGRGNLTYEEALICESNAIKKVQQIPKELIFPVLSDVQFSMLTLKDLVNSIAEKFQGQLLEGSELYGMKNNHVTPCKIIKILEEDTKTKFEVAWLEKDKKVPINALVSAEDLITKLPFTRGTLKSFIKESTYRSGPWVLHDKLAKKHGISTDPPQELKGIISLRDGVVVCSRKRKKVEDEHGAQAKSGEFVAITSVENADGEYKKPKKQHIRYPIDDLLVGLAGDDHKLTERPSPCRDFSVPMGCVGDLLMVWDFCTSFGRLLHLSPFSLEDFEGALGHKDSNVVLLVECHSALLRLLMKDNGKFSLSVQNRKRKPKITLITWTEYLCDFLEMIGVLELCSHITMIKRGHYGLLDIHIKLGILKELLAQALETNLLRTKLDENYDQRQAFAATKREKAIEEGKKRREEKRRLKGESEAKELTGTGSSDTANDSVEPVEVNPAEENGNVLKKLDKTVKSPSENSITLLCSLQMHDSEEEQTAHAPKKNAKNQKADLKAIPNGTNDSTKRKIHKMMKKDIKETIEKKSKEQRKEYLEREIEKRFIRHSPLGKDRDYNRYWFFRRDGRIFIENSDSTQWGYYSCKEELDAFMGSLNPKGVREWALKKQLQKHYDKICSELLKRSKDLAQKIAMEEAVLRRSTRVRAPPRDNPALAFLKYENKWKED
ncbi:unnamed protein product [Coffea canephora]|uniref:DH200=94 genomic scaffold, scaffold_269 n=2 Tax=Coffea TaxID=13442 RepID=A0A068VGA4_COFCA|nr:unnamed protein product [Coffea canephora]